MTVDRHAKKITITVSQTFLGLSLKFFAFLPFIVFASYRYAEVLLVLITTRR
jgi:hypothetical protein